jgi:hypothetical protein
MVGDGRYRVDTPSPPPSTQGHYPTLNTDQLLSLVPNKTSNTMYRLSDSNLFTSDSQGRYIRLAHRMNTARLQWSSPYSDWFLGVNKKPSGSPVVCHRLNGNGNPPKAKDQPVSRLLYSII